MDKPLTVLIADDHVLVRKGLRQVLESEENVIVAEAGDGEAALRYIREHKPQMAILDVEMPRMTGFDVALRAQRESLSTDIIFLTMFKDESVFNKAMDIGAKGYVLKDNTVSEIVQCIRRVAGGKYYLSPSISDYLVRRSAKRTSLAADKHGLNLLTHSERNIMKLLSTMMTNNEIAETLGISVKTVHNHRNNICDKLGLSGAHALLKFAVEHVSQF